MAKSRITQRVVSGGVVVQVDENLVKWGNLVGNISNQTDLVDALDQKADEADIYKKWELDEFISYLATKKELENYLTKSEATTKYATKDELENFQKKGDYVTSDEFENGLASLRDSQIFIEAIDPNNLYNELYNV